MYRQHFPDDPGMHNTAEARTTRRSRSRGPVTLTFVQRIRNSLVAIMIGLVLVCIAMGLLFWNEGRAVQTAQSIDEGMELVQPLGHADVVLDKNNGKLVHVTAPLKTSEVLYDELYGVALSALRLRRKVEMFQWAEQEHRRESSEGEHTREEISYTYTTQWASELVRSSSFQSPYNHENPTSMSVLNRDYMAEDAQVGSLLLSQSLISKVSKFKPFMPTEVKPDSHVKLYLGMFYHSENPLDPQVGDLRVTFEYAGLASSQITHLGPPDVVSVIAKQAGHTLEAFHTDAGDELEYLYIGNYSPEKIFGQERMTNALITWGLRFVGWLLMFIGFSCMTALFTVLVDWLPIIRDLVNMGMNTLSVALSISLSLTVIALGWIRYRPLLGMLILVFAASPLVLSRLNRLRAQHTRTV